MANDSITVIESAEQYNELVSSQHLSTHCITLTSIAQVNSGKTTIIDFWADWCAPCKAIAPRFEKLAQSNDDGNLIFAKVELNMEDPNHWTGPVTQELKVVSVSRRCLTSGWLLYGCSSLTDTTLCGPEEWREDWGEEGIQR
jgi:thioredoxin 1